MIKKFFIVFCLLVVSKVGFAQNTNQTMTKVVVRYISTSYPANSFAAQPVTHYRSGEKYGRTEEAVDSVMGIHGLIIVNEPDSWMINLISRTGVHERDGGPTFVCHDPIVGPEGRTDADLNAFTHSLISKFEFGKEMEFLKNHQAKKLSNHYELTIEGYKIEMFTKGETQIPYQLKIFKGESQLYLQYDEYKTDLPFDPLLFVPPTDVKISEQN